MITSQDFGVRPDRIDGIGPWVWRKGDLFAWSEPAKDWPAISTAALAHTPKRRAMIQAGGCMGMYPRLWAQHFAVVYTFEPDAKNFYCLAANCPGNVIKFQAALGYDRKTCAYQEAPEYNAGQGRMADESGYMPVLRLDDLSFRDVDLIQLDCEGAELEIITGAIETIKRWQPTLCIEAPSKELCNHLQHIGYAERASAGDNPDRVFVRSNVSLLSRPAA